MRFPSWNEAILPIDLPISDVLDKVDSLRRFDPRRVQLHQLLINPIADLLPQNPEDAIVSLWAVPDAPTANLTLAFYQNSEFRIPNSELRILPSPFPSDIIYKFANSSVASINALVIPGSLMECPASGTTTNFDSGQARCNSHALTIGHTTS